MSFPARCARWTMLLRILTNLQAGNKQISLSNMSVNRLWQPQTVRFIWLAYVADNRSWVKFSTSMSIKKISEVAFKLLRLFLTKCDTFCQVKYNRQPSFSLAEMIGWWVSFPNYCRGMIVFWYANRSCVLLVSGDIRSGASLEAR